MSKAAERGGVKITQAWVDDAPKGTHTIGDGLILKVVEKNGRRYSNFILRAQVAGVRKDFAIGSSTKVKLADAKIKAGLARAAIASGDDVKVAIGSEKANPQFRPNPTQWHLASVVDRTFEAERRSLKGDGEAGRWRSPLDLHVLPLLGKKHVEDLTVDDLRKCLGKIWTSKPETARKAGNRLKKVLRHARLEGAACDERFVDDARALLGPQNVKTAHIAATPYANIPALYAAICDLEQTPATMCLRLTLLTAQRGKPVRTAMLEQFALDKRVWTIPGASLKGREGKTSDFTCPLSSEAVRVVEIASQYARGGKLFPAQRGAGFVTDVGVSKVLNRLKEPGRVHGLRSSFRDWAENEGVDYVLAETSLQHSVGSNVERAYRRDERLEARRDVLERWATYATSERYAGRRACLQVV